MFSVLCTLLKLRGLKSSNELIKLEMQEKLNFYDAAFPF